MQKTKGFAAHFRFITHMTHIQTGSQTFIHKIFLIQKQLLLKERIPVVLMAFNTLMGFGS